MLMDQHALFCEDFVIPVGTGKKLVGDVIDLEDLRDIGSTDNIWIVAQVTEAITSAGAATVQALISSDAQAAISVDGTESQHLAGAVIAKANAIIGAVLLKAILPLEGVVTYERYLGLIIDVGTAALTAGKVTVFTTMHPPVIKNYPDGAR